MNNGKICISICAKTTDELFEKIARAEALADVIELRFDCLNPDQVDPAIEKLPTIEKTYLLTYRPSEQGGMRVLPLNARLMFWKKVLPALAGRVDGLEHEPGAEQLIRALVRASRGRPASAVAAHWHAPIPETTCEPLVALCAPSPTRLPVHAVARPAVLTCRTESRLASGILTS